MRLIKIMTDFAIKGSQNCVFMPDPLQEKHQTIFFIKLVDGECSKFFSKNAFNSDNKIQICPIPLSFKLQDRQRNEFVSSSMLVINVL